MTIVVGSTVPDVAGILGIDLLAMDRLLPFEASVEEGASPLALFAEPGAVIIVEPNGWITAQPETVAALAVLGRTVALYWNVNYVSRFIVAENGEIVRDFDPVVDAGAGTGGPLPEEGGIDWGSDPIGKAAALQARLTGTALTRGQVFGTPYPTTTAPWPN